MAAEEVTLQEFAAVKPGYRSRLVVPVKGPRVLDVREYLDGTQKSGWEGFTRKGLRVTREQAEVLAEVIREALKAGL